MAGKMAFEYRAFIGNLGVDADCPRIEVEVDDSVDELEILDPHDKGCASVCSGEVGTGSPKRTCVASRSSPLGGDKTVDACAQILEHEILFGGGLAVVDFLGPLLQRKLDSESLVDRKRDIEEIEAVDPKVIDR